MTHLEQFHSGNQPPAEYWTTWTAPDGSAWIVTFRLERIAGRYECVEFRIRPRDEHQETPLRAKTLRALDFAGCLARARRETRDAWTGVMERARELGYPRDDWLVREAGIEKTIAALREGQGRKSGRHAKYTQADLERVAVVYAAAYANGTQPTRDTSEALGISYNQTAKLVQRCRKAGLLPETTPGFARGPEEDT